jgi:hypothetical protein
MRKRFTERQITKVLKEHPQRLSATVDSNSIGPFCYGGIAMSCSGEVRKLATGARC